jgi:phosphatidylserine decarboxylase
MIPTSEWLKSEEVKGLRDMPIGKLVSKEFFRDPLRPVYIDPTVLYAPADGIVLYAYDDIGPDEAVVEIKGKKFTVRDALDDKAYEPRSLVVGIFMTIYDVHINRLPTGGCITAEHRTPYLFTPNISMEFEEEDIVKKAMPEEKDLSYLFCNERKIVSVYNPKIKIKYYLVQIAEKDVDVILNWGMGKDHTQGDRYGEVRYGSQVDLIIPLTGKTKYEMLAKKNYHVQAGVDAIVRIIGDGNSV